MTIDNINDRADAYEAVLRETFSHPDVGGIVQWEVARVPCSLLRLPTCSKKCTNCLTSPTFKDNLVGKRSVTTLQTSSIPRSFHVFTQRSFLQVSVAVE